MRKIQDSNKSIFADYKEGRSNSTQSGVCDSSPAVDFVCRVAQERGFQHNELFMVQASEAGNKKVPLP